MKICTAKDSCVMEEKSDEKQNTEKIPSSKLQTTQISVCSGGYEAEETEEELDVDLEEDEDDNDDVFLPDNNQDLSEVGGYVESDEYSGDDASGSNTSPNISPRHSQRNPRHGDTVLTSSDRVWYEGWDRQLEYLLSSCGFVVNIYSVLKFPQLSVVHGGGVFFVAYFILILVCGFPLLYMEMILGQYSRSSSVKAWNVIPIFKGIGWGMTLLCMFISLYNHITISWAMLYVWKCFTMEDWCTYGRCADNASRVLTPVLNVTHTSLFPLDASPPAYEFYRNTLDISSGLGDMGSLQWTIAVCIVIVWLFLFLSTITGPHSIGKVTYVTFIVAMVMYGTLMVRLFLEEGVISGIKYFLNLQWSKLGNLQLWLDAGHLMFMSLGLGTGCLTTLAGHTHFHSHCFRNAFFTVLGHLVAMMLSGFTMFSMLGVYTQGNSLQIPDLNFTDWELGFTVFPVVLGQMEGSRVWSAILFVVLILLQFDTQCIYVHNTIAGVLQAFRDRPMFKWRYKYIVQAVLCLLLMCSSLLVASQSGLYLVHFMSSSVCKVGLLLLGLLECLSLSWMYGAQRLWNNVADMTGSTDSPWWKVTWRFVTPASIMILITMTVYLNAPLQYGGYVYPDWTMAVMWVITMVPVIPVPIELVRVLSKETDTFIQRIKKLKMTPMSWGPGPFANQDHVNNDVPDYVICTPDIYKPQHGLALLTANLYIPNLSNLVTAQESQDAEMASGYLSDAVTLDSGGSEDSDEDNSYRDSWSSRLEFVLSCLGYVVGLGNVWRFPYLVYQNGGGAFFIPYGIMLVFCGMPLVYLELAFGQYASLGPITVWRAVPIFKGIGISMVLSTAIVSVYYNIVNAWAFHFLFSSMASSLPWLNCDNPWNQDSCNTGVFKLDNCSLVNQTFLNMSDYNHSCVATVIGCQESNTSSAILTCMTTLFEHFGDILLLEKPSLDLSRTSPSEDYFYHRVLKMSENSLGNLGTIQWELALCLLLSWTIVFISLVRGIRTSGKIAYFVVTFPFIIILALLVRALMMEGYMEGIKFYVTPKWEKLKEPGVWADAAVQVFFSLSACVGGLTTLASYNKFHNNIYSDAVLVVAGDTLMSVLAGFSVFAMMGVLASELNTSVEHVITSGIGLTFIVNPAAMSYFPVAPLWSILFFLMIIMLGLSTQFVNIETIITAIIDENVVFFKRRRTLVLFVVCVVLFLFGLPLTTQGGMYILQLMDEYAAGFPVMINGIFICIAVGWVYGVQQFARDIKHMIGQNVGVWWKALWCVISPVIITFILVFSAIGYKPLSEKYDTDAYPAWAEVIGFLILLTPVIFIPTWAVIKLILMDGSFKQRFKKACQSDTNWGPALERHWKNVEYFPAVNANALSVDIERSFLHTVTDNVDFTTVGVRVPSLSSQTSLLPKSLSPKKPRDMRERAILNHAYSNPQCHQSTASIEKASSSTQADNLFFGSDVIVVPRVHKKVKTFDKYTQTDASYTGRGRKLSYRSPKASTSSQKSHSSSISDDSPAVLEVEVTHF